MKVIFEIKREGNRWYVNDDNGFSKEDNQLVGNAPSVIESLVGRTDRAMVTVSDENFEGAMRLDLLDADIGDGVQYTIETEDGEEAVWLCSVFFYYVPKALPVLYFNIERLV